jgi:hypothetical protein
MSEVFLNSRYIGKVTSGKDYANQLVNLRRNNKFPASVNVFYDSRFDQEDASGRSL